MSSVTQQFNSDLGELRGAISRAKPACQGLGFESAQQIISSLKDELEEFEQAVKANELRPLPGQSFDKGVYNLGNSSKQVNQSVAQLLSATSQGNEVYSSKAARDTAQNLKLFSGAIRTIASTSDNQDTQKELLRSGQDVMLHSARLIEEARHSCERDAGVTQQMSISAKKISQSLADALNCLPGQKDIDTAIVCIKEWTAAIDTGKFPSTNKTYGELQQKLNTAAANLNEASSDVVTSVRNPPQLASSSKDFGSAFYELLHVSMEMAGQSKDVQARGDMVHSIRNVSTVSSNLLTTAKTLSADPDLPNGKNQLAAAARAVTESINHLVNVCTSSAPGQTECDNAIRNIQAMKPLLDNPTEPINDFSYYECLDAVMEKSKMLGDGMTGITESAKKSDHDTFSDKIKIVNASICGFIEASAQASYLVGISDSSSVAGRPGLVDQTQFARASQAIQQGCASLTSPTSAQQQVLTAATLIAKHTSALCNACRVASSKTTNPVAKRHFVESAKDVANSTALLVKEIKVLDSDCSEENRRKCAEATQPLLGK